MLFQQRIGSHTGIKAVSASSYLPGQGISMGMNVKKSAADENTWIDYLAVDTGYIPAMDLQLIAGHNFAGLDSAKHEKFIIINETAVRKLNLGDPQSAVGQFITTDQKNLQIIGVVKDFVLRRKGETIEACALRNTTDELRYTNIHLTGNKVSNTLKDLEADWKEIDPLHPFKYKFYDDALAAAHIGFSIIMKVVGFAGFLSVSIACFGLLGISIYNTESRMKELSIRKVLGAGSSSLVMLLSKSFLRLILLAVVIGTPAGYLISSAWLQNYAYRVDVGAGTLLAGIGIIFFLALLTVGVQVLKSVRANPVDYLKPE
jgi:putative ABC transport system permease protein